MRVDPDALAEWSRTLDRLPPLADGLHLLAPTAAPAGLSAAGAELSAAGAELSAAPAELSAAPAGLSAAGAGLSAAAALHRTNLDGLRALADVVASFDSLMDQLCSATMAATASYSFVDRQAASIVGSSVR